MNKVRRKRLVDRLFNAYVTWRETCLQVSDAYSKWTRERSPEGTFAFESYMAALDSEESAAEVYARLVRRAGQLLAGEQDAGRSPSLPARESRTGFP